MKPVIFFRQVDHDREEFTAAQKHFNVVTQRALIPQGSLVIPRYSALPNYKELEEDVRLWDSRLINTYEQHRFIADIRQYAPVLGDLTPATWDNWANLPPGKSFVVKGVTNSRKNQWATRMFARTAADIPRIAMSLLDDAEIADQGLVVREYVPLVQYGVALNNLPITNEWRFFVLNGKILMGGYYWSDYWTGENGQRPIDTTTPPQGAIDVVERSIERIGGAEGRGAAFYVVDVGERFDGGWIVIELNDGQMSGLPCLDSNEFYRRLAEAL